MSNINLKELQNSLTPSRVIQLVTELGSDEYIEKEDYIIFKTICHNEDAHNSSMKLYYYKKDHRFVCYTDCGCSFNIFTLFQKRYDLLKIEHNFYKDIVLKIADGVTLNNNAKSGFYHEYESAYNKYKKDIPNINYKHYNEEILNSFSFFAAPEWTDDGISEEIMKIYNIRYCINQNKIIIPHYDINNRLVGIRGRALNESEIAYAKYAPVKIEDIVYKHKLSLNLYGLNHNWKNIKELGICYIAESEKAVLQSELFGEKNCTVAICGSSLNIYQIKLLMQHCQPKEIVLCLDKEELPGEDKYFYKLWDMCNKYKLYTNMSFIYDRENLLNLKDSPFDRGRNIFNKLLEKRVKVK